VTYDRTILVSTNHGIAISAIQMDIFLKVDEIWSTQFNNLATGARLRITKVSNISNKPIPKAIFKFKREAF
jgi:hypothetical protein